MLTGEPVSQSFHSRAAVHHAGPCPELGVLGRVMNTSFVVNIKCEVEGAPKLIVQNT
jgi:hypothetical protein